MSTLRFKYNIRKDAWSWVLIAKNKNLFGLDWKNQVSHIPKDLLSKIEKLSFSGAKNIVENYLRKHPKRRYREIIIKKELTGLNEVWRRREKEFFKILSIITKKPIYRDNFECFFTTGFMCPYNEKGNWFTVSMWHSLPFSLTTIAHELSHLQFLHYYKKYLKKRGLTDKNIEDLKESLTFLLNEPEFEEVILVEDKGYPKHQGLRKKLKKVWEKKKNFKEFLEKSIKTIKGRNI